MTSNLPTGTVTFLFTDIEGSTQLWEQYPDAMKTALAKHDSILKEAIEANHGHFVKTTGDGVHAVFATAIDAVNSSIFAQRAIQTSEFFKNSEVLLRVRMGLHTGEAELRDSDYYGQSLNRSARIMSAGHGGQILISAVTAQVARGHLPTEISFLDLGEHQLKGLGRLERIFQLIAPDLQKEFPALTSIATATNNLPPQLTSFIGREHELGEAKEKLKSSRLLTLIGPGGTGKTRLSLQLAAETLSDFTDGIWFVELAPLTDPALILQTVASILNLRAQMGMPLKDVVVDYLRAKNLLLILDNCEHLIESCAQLADEFLHIAPKLKIIASSREALGINGETVYRVPSLSLPDQTQTSPETLDGFESIQLFVERARAVNPKFDLTEKNAASVAQICRRLDGIPLALELAAARVTVFPPEQIASRLDDRFKLLTGGSRTALPRQQTLRALIDWSYDILPEDERALLRRLSVFAGGWTFEAVEAICPELDVLSGLTQLVNKSLVVVDDEGEQTRYRLLETIRQYARDKLLETGESIETRNLHLDFFLKFAEQAGPLMNTLNAVDLIPQLDAEHDNLRAAFEWGQDNHVDASLRFVNALSNFWIRRGHGVEGIQWANAALVREDQLPRLQDDEAARQKMLLRANALSALTWLAYTQGDNPNAVKASAESIGLARQLGDKRILAISLTMFGSAKVLSGDPANARASVEEAVALAREGGEKYGLGMALNMLAMIVMMVDHDFKTAQAYGEESIAIFNENRGDSWDTNMAFFGVARGAMFRRDYAAAREGFKKVLPAFQEMKDEHRVNMIYSELAHIDRYEGRYREAETVYRKTIVVWQKLGHRAAIAHQFESFAFIAKIYEDVERATRLLGAAEALREKINIPMSPPERAEYEREIADLRAGLAEKTFTSLWDEGRAMTIEQAIQFTLQ